MSGVAAIVMAAVIAANTNRKTGDTGYRVRRWLMVGVLGGLWPATLILCLVATASAGNQMVRDWIGD